MACWKIMILISPESSVYTILRNDIILNEATEFSYASDPKHSQFIWDVTGIYLISVNTTVIANRDQTIVTTFVAKSSSYDMKDLFPAAFINYYILPNDWYSSTIAAPTT